jgi:transposase
VLKLIIVGIDIAKNNHEATIIDSLGNIVTKSFRFPNSHSGSSTLIRNIAKANASNEAVIIGMEATGHYWLPLYSRLLSEGFDVRVINPIQSDSFRNLYIRQTKNDSKDSFIIAEVIRFGRFSSTCLAEEDILSLRNLSRFRLFQVDMVSDLKRKVISLLDQVFPEYSKLFSDTFGKSSLEILSEYSTPEEFLAVDTTALAEILAIASRGQLGYSKAEQIKDAAANSFGIKIALDTFSFQIKQLIEQIKFIEDHIAELEIEISNLLKKLNTPIETIPGIGPILGAVILSEIGDITRFKDASKLVAFAGIDPTVKQSGEFIGTQNKMSKRGSPYLRRAIWLAAHSASLSDPVLSAYYNKKREEGKHHFTAIGAVARKLLYIVHAVLKSNKPYTPMN